MEFSLDVFRQHLYQEDKKRKKAASDLRYGKKKYRIQADSPVEDVIDIIEQHDKKPAAKPKARKLDEAAEKWKKLKAEDMNNLPTGRTAKASRKRK